ncbi:hypothetical protein C2857_000411 [Epichloe festucae Fl1]|uniref:BHLH domain-containing protein n=1 Tax=Epichloe festucae (strain Fl1) TaxID=877507 RepID=A0A7S9PRF8_EPIFF|nr:hypothetical protein C2857_000411 [Epichloe festucae Fl1]
MEVNYYPDELNHWALDYTTLAASSPGKFQEYEPILLPGGIDLWPHGGLPFSHAGSLGVAGNNKAPLNRFQTAHRKLQCPPQIPTGPRVSNHHDPSFAHDMTQSPQPRRGSYPWSVDVDDTPLASPLTPPSDAWTTRAQCSRQDAHAAATGGDLCFQSFDDFRDDIRRSSVETESNAALPERWCLGFDTTTAASLMHWTQAERSRPLENPSQHHQQHHQQHQQQHQQQPLDQMRGPPPYEQTYHHHHHHHQVSSVLPQACAHTDDSMAFMRPRRGKQSIEQRRRNHIRQEQKRRAVLKNGFADLADMIPDLAKRDMSKSVVLEKTAEWLERLICGNNFLRERLSLLESRSRGNGLMRICDTSERHGIPRSS